MHLSSISGLSQSMMSTTVFTRIYQWQVANADVQNNVINAFSVRSFRQFERYLRQGWLKDNIDSVERCTFSSKAFKFISLDVLCCVV